MRHGPASIKCIYRGIRQWTRKNVPPFSKVACLSDRDYHGNLVFWGVRVWPVRKGLLYMLYPDSDSTSIYWALRWVSGAMSEGIHVQMTLYDEYLNLPLGLEHPRSKEMTKLLEFELRPGPLFTLLMVSPWHQVVSSRILQQGSGWKEFCQSQKMIPKCMGSGDSLPRF